jgi:hypothetical protein
MEEIERYYQEIIEKIIISLYDDLYARLDELSTLEKENKIDDDTEIFIKLFQKSGEIIGIRDSIISISRVLWNNPNLTWDQLINYSQEYSNWLAKQN